MQELKVHKTFKNMKSKILLTASSLFLLQSCMLYDIFQQAPTTEEPFFKEEGNINISPSELTSGPPALLIEGGVANDKLYAGMANDIKIYVEGGSTEHLQISASPGRLDTLDKSQGKFSFFEKNSGFITEIVAKDPISGQLVAKVFDIVTVPAPSAYIWKYKSIFKGQLNFTATQFKEQTAVILQHDYAQIPIRCAASSYTIVRIDATGKRQTCDNTNASGMFDEASKKLIAEAQKGDIYIFKSIKSDCSPNPIKDIVYTIE